MDEFDKMFGAEAQPNEFEQMFGAAPAAPPVGGIRTPKEPGGFIASAKQAVGATIKGAGQLAADIGIGGQDNALKQYGQSVVDANPTAVKGFGDIVDKPLTTVKEATGNAAGSLGTMLGIRAVGQGITAAAPLTGPAAPFVAGAGQLISWAGPAAVAALPSFGGIREKQIEKDPEATSSWGDKAVAALGAGTVGLIETKFGPQDWALKLTTEAGRKQLSGMLASETIKGAIGKGAVKGALVEGGEELVQNPVEQIASGDNPLSQASLEETAFGGVMGAVGGGVLGGGLGPAVRTKSVPREEEKPQVDPTTNVVQKETLNAATPDEVRIDKVEGETATVTVGDRSVELPIKEAAEAVAIGTLDEVLAEKEALPPVEELPQEASLPTTTFLRQNGEARGFLPPVGRTIEQVREETAEMSPREKLKYFEENKASNYRYKLLDGTEQGGQNDTASVTQSGAVPQDRVEVADTVSQQAGAGVYQEPSGDIGPIEGPARQGAEPAGQGINEEFEVPEEPAQAEPAQAAAPQRGVIGEMLGTGEVRTTASGRQTTPFPKVSTDTNRKTQNTSKRVDAWLIANAAEEARSRGDDFNLRQFENMKNPSQADKDSAEMYLFGEEQPQVVPSILKPLLSKTQEQPTIRHEGEGVGGHYYTVLDGPAKGATFVSKTQDPADVQARLEETQAKFAPKQAQGDGGSTFVAQVQKELKAFLGSGYDNLVRRGKLEVVRSEADLGEQGDPLRTTSGAVVGSYFPSQKKIYLFSDRLTPGAAADVLKHEAGHALLSEDKLFREQRTKILKDFATLARNNPKIKEAFDKVPADTAKGFRGEEGLMYFLGDPKNRKHSIFKRVLSAVKAALYRLGLAYGRLSESDLVALFSQGTRAWANRKQDQELGSGRSLQEILSGLGEFAQDPLLSVKEAGRKIRGLAAFKKWFGDSKVVDSEGNPLVVYHGNAALVDSFRPQSGIFFTDSAFIASTYSTYRANKTGGASRTYPVYLSISNPLIVDAEGQSWADFDPEQYVQEAKTGGNDGVIIRNIDDAATGVGVPATTYVVFKPTQIKSIFNQGTWDGKNPDILFSKVSDKLKAGKENVEGQVKKMFGENAAVDFLNKYADGILGFAPLSHMSQWLGSKYQALKNLNRISNEATAVRSQIVDNFVPIHDRMVKAAKNKAGLDAANEAMMVATTNQMTMSLDKSLDITDQTQWVPESSGVTLSTDQRLKAAEQKWKDAGMKTSTGMTFKEAYADTMKSWNKLSEPSKKSYLEIREYLKNLKDRQRSTSLAFIESMSEPDTKLRADLMERFNSSFSTILGDYFPLTRYGDFILEFTTKDGQRYSESFTDMKKLRTVEAQALKDGFAQEDTIVRKKADKSAAAATAIPLELISQLRGVTEARYTQGIDPADVDSMEDAKARAQSAVDDLNQTLLRWLPDTSALKNTIHRKNIQGADKNMLRGVMNYVTRHAGAIAWTEKGRLMENEIKMFAEETKAKAKDAEGAIDLIQRGHILTYMRRWLKATRDEKTGPIASAAGKLSTFWMMTSPSTFLVQLTQVPALVLPHLSARYKSVPAAMAALSKGMQQAFSKKYSKEAMYGDAKVNEVYAALHRTVTYKEATEERPVGTPWFTGEQQLAMINGKDFSDYQRQLLILREAEMRNSLDISAVHEAEDVAHGIEDTKFGKVFKYMMMPMKYGELGSRKAAILATFDLATNKEKMNFFDALEEATDVADKTLFNFDKNDKGWIMQKSILRVPMTFQTYRIKTMLRIALLFKDMIKGETKDVQQAARREFFGIMGMSTVLGGATGTLFASTGFAIASLLFGDDDEPYDPELEFVNYMKELLGEKGGEVASFGLASLLGQNISRRIGMGDMFGMQSEPPSNLHGAGLAAWWAGNLIGPSFSVAQGWVKGYDEIVNKGNYERGLEAATPKPIRDMLKAYRFYTEGLKNAAGKKLMADEDITPGDVLMVALGFSPSEITAASSAERSLVKMGTKLTERRGKLIRAAARAIVESEDTTDALEAIRVFNSKLPLFAISGRDIKPAVRKLVLGEMGTTGVRQRQVATQFGIETYSGE